MAREDSQLKLRLPADLKALIEASAEAGKRSLNAEIVLRLQQSLEKDRSVPTSGEVHDALLGLMMVFKDFGAGLKGSSQKTIDRAAHKALANLEETAKHDRVAARFLDDLNERESQLATKDLADKGVNQSDE